MATTPGSLTNWAGNIAFDATRVHQPESLDQLRRLVEHTPRIRALGSGHSFSDAAVTSGDLVRLDRLPGEVCVDPAGRTVTVPAGMSYARLAAELERSGFALANLASLPHISVAGSCATGTHGSGDGLRGLAAAVRALQLVGPGGELVGLSRTADPETFPGSVVALGALGIVTALVVDIEPSYQVAQRVRLDVPLAEVAARWDDVFGAAYSASVFTDYAGGTANVWLKSRADRPASGWLGGRAADHPVHPVPGVPPEWCTVQLGVAGPWHERLPHFRPEFVPGAGKELQSEYFLPRPAGPTVLAGLAAVAGRFAPALQIGEVRTVRGDDLWLSPAYGRDTATFHFTWTDDPDAALPAISAVEELLLPMGARPHWAKLTAATPGELIDCYPRRHDFELLMRRFDPNGKFGNDLIAALFPSRLE
jgi:xylitol oxidase